LEQQSELSTSLLTSLITLMSDLLSEHSSNLAELKETNGVSILAYLFQKLYLNFNVLSVRALDKFIQACSSNGTVIHIIIIALI
jgi:hypothetical protein